MIRLPRPRISLPVIAVGAPIVGAITTTVAAITAALAADWSGAAMAGLATAWALIAALWAYRATTHACPPPEPPEPAERGLQCVHFVGGPEDGGTGIIPGARRDLHRATLTVEGADYSVGAVAQTCYRAELAPAQEVAQ